MRAEPKWRRRTEFLAGVVTRYCDPGDKRDFVSAYCARHDIDMAQCVAVGNSRSDIPLFGAVGLAIALNATADANAAAHIALNTDDLTELLPFLLPERR